MNIEQASAILNEVANGYYKVLDSVGSKNAADVLLTIKQAINYLTSEATSNKQSQEDLKEANAKILEFEEQKSL